MTYTANSAVPNPLTLMIRPIPLRPIRPERTLRTARTISAALVFLFLPVVAAAQTVVLRGVPPGSVLEVFVNASQVGSGPADTAGDARVPFDLPAAAAGRTETEANIHVDACGTVRRVLIVESGFQPPALEAGCDRRDITGLFVIRRVSTVIVNAGGSVPTILLRQGSVNLAQLGIPVVAPTGLMIFGGGGYGSLGNVRDVACGVRTQCAGGLFKGGLTAGVLYWITPNIGAEAAYVLPQQVNITGSVDRARFGSSLDTRLFTVVGKVGGLAGRARIYGQGGMNRHEAVFRTDQTLDEVTLTAEDGTTAVLPAGSWVGEMKTTGWGWLLGGGAEAWTSQRFAVYVEGGLAKIKGPAAGGAEGALDDRSTYFRVGARFRIGG